MQSSGLTKKRRFAALIALCLSVGLAVGWYVLAPGWQKTGDAARLSPLPGELFFVEAKGLAHRGSDRLAVVRLDGPVEVVPHHFRAHGLAQPVAIDVWAELLGAPLIVNAGQFDDANEHLGWLKARGTWLRRKKHPAWFGLLASGRQLSASPGRHPTQTTILDMAAQLDDLSERYDNLVQSMMLFDEQKGPRVRQSEQSACRTVVAEDHRGRLLFLVTEGAVTLFELAQYLQGSPLGLVRAMNLDGGIESQLAVWRDNAHLSLFGQYGAERTSIGAHHVLGHAPLPSVLAISVPKL